VPDLPLPLSVKVVSHDIYKVQVFRNLGYVVSRRLEVSTFMLNTKYIKLIYLSDN
jgi:hypothetical protein